MAKNSALPKHIAIIPDGNRRWAREKGKKAWEGHFEGAKRIEEISKAAVEAGIEYLTIWGGSYDNLTKRPSNELKALDRVYYSLAQSALKDKGAYENGVRVRFFGEWEKLLSGRTVSAIREVEMATKKHDRYNMTYLIGYSGDREMLDAVRRIARSKPTRVTPDTIKRALWTADLPPVDLIIRTGNDPHLSAGFMMWDTRYSLLSFSSKMWPDFKKKDFLKEISSFSSRERRFGK